MIPVKIYTAPEVTLSPQGNITIAEGDSFTFNCSVTVKIPSLPIDILIDGQQQHSESRIIPSRPPLILHPLYIQEYSLQNITSNDSLTTVQCRVFVATSSREFFVTSQLATLFVAGELIR